MKLPPHEFDKIVCEEVNVKKLTIYICSTEKGDLSLVYEVKTNNYYIVLNGKKLSPQPEKLLKKCLNEII